ncbi:MAG: S26 family signal peptidase, partial [Marinirhabdus sp.]
FQAHLTDGAYEKFKNYPNLDTIVPLKSEKGVYNQSTFPRDDRYPWNNDFFGPLYIPEKGATVTISQKTLPLYKRIIETYEGSEMGHEQKISLNGNQVLMNGQPLTQYTFKMNYYWMMGDNRSNSQDARSWGFVPFNHVVGKPVFVWMSWDSNATGLMNKIRWERLFTTVGGTGTPVSYFRYFLIALAGYFVFRYFRRRKQGAKK